MTDRFDSDPRPSSLKFTTTLLKTAKTRSDPINKIK